MKQYKKYTKTKVVAKNRPTGSYAAGCPANTMSGSNAGVVGGCRSCERSA